ncbi:unnamed protein product, partial [Meganyctiphanes norvegica]
MSKMDDDDVFECDADSESEYSYKPHLRNRRRLSHEKIKRKATFSFSEDTKPPSGPDVNRKRKSKTFSKELKDLVPEVKECLRQWVRSSYCRPNSRMWSFE